MIHPKLKAGGTPARRRAFWLCGVLVLAVALLLLWLWQRRPGRAVAVSDPRLTAATPYRNVRPDVRYVGDAACAECHPSHAESYHQHPMGRSLAPVAQVAANQRYDAGVHNPFETEGFRYQVVREGDRVFHQETVADAQGRVVADRRVEMDFVIGSGARAHSYLFQRDGFLFESPITWYAQKGTWDLSPGYRGRRFGFERGIVQECLFCHCDRADHVENTVNQYRQPIFQGLAIGCERCHGPGELHVERRHGGEPVAGLDDTIVNPADLDVPSREAICQQCHLQGAVRVLRRGLDAFAFRPGLPLHLFWSVFVRPPEFADHLLVGQVEQMTASRCYQASSTSKKLGCISCHDPHALPAPEQRIAHYRNSCLQCHQEQSCTLAADRRRRKVPDDSCIACHMPRLATVDIVHTAVTDHRIVRQAQEPARTLPTRVLRPGEIPLVYFHRDWNDANDPEVQRDLGLALVDLAREASPVRRQLSQTAEPILEAALQRWPNDAAAWEAQGRAQSVQERAVEALASCEQALALAPNRQTALADAAAYAQALGKRSAAITYCQRLLAIDPWASARRFQLAQLWADSKEWEKAAEECREVLRTNPTHLNAHLLLTAYYLETKDRSRAQAELEIVLALHPRNPEAIRRWYRDKTGGR
ncbi:MAG TPA: tetratricopeptide repeat protein [Gemmataceae bacterium]|nr:tetratricopeptide repeat protein [Gemmataceae bacterium]